MLVKLEWLCYLWWKNCDDMLSRFHLIPERNGQTDGRTDRFAISIPRVNMLMRDKNGEQQTGRPRCKTLDSMMNSYRGNGYLYQNFKEMPRWGTWRLVASPSARHQRTLHDHAYGQCMTQCHCLVSQFSPGTQSYLPTEGRLRLSRPGCLVLHRGGLPVQRRSPTQALTGPSVEQLRYDTIVCS